MISLKKALIASLSTVVRLKNLLYSYLIPKHFPVAYKLATIMTLLISSGMILLGMVIVNNQTHLLQKQMNRFANTIIEQLADNAKESLMSDDMLNLMVLLNNLNLQDNVLGTAIYTNEGKIVSSIGVTPNNAISNSYKDSKYKNNNKKHFQIKWKTFSNAGQPIKAISYLSPIKFQKINVGHALVTFSTDEIEQTISEMIKAIIIATIIMISVGILASLHMGRRISKPLNTLMDASINISKGNYQYKIEEQRNDELGQLNEAFNAMANDLFEKEKAENAFSRYVSKNIAENIINNIEDGKLGGNYVDASVIFADIVGFTNLSEEHTSEQVANVLNDYFTYISLICKICQGTIDKYIGDCAMIVFGVHEPDPSHKLHAVYCAVMIQKLVKRINEIRKNSQQLSVSFRIGINSGNMLAGNLGSNEQMQYTVIGESVNLAARLQNIAEENKIIVSRNFYDDPNIQWRLIAEEYKLIQLKGIKNKVSTFQISDVIAFYQDDMDKKINEILQIKPAA